MAIKKILIANRGEIAVRIISTCREMGIETISVYTEEEKDLIHVFESDMSVNLGAGDLSQTYLNMKKLINIAKENGADAIHPGYGFLSENSQFAREVTNENLISWDGYTNFLFIMPRKEMIGHTHHAA